MGSPPCRQSQGLPTCGTATIKETMKTDVMGWVSGHFSQHTLHAHMHTCPLSCVRCAWQAAGLAFLPFPCNAKPFLKSWQAPGGAGCYRHTARPIAAKAGHPHHSTCSLRLRLPGCSGARQLTPVWARTVMHVRSRHQWPHGMMRQVCHAFQVLSSRPLHARWQMAAGQGVLHEFADQDISCKVLSARPLHAPLQMAAGQGDSHEFADQDSYEPAYGRSAAAPAKTANKYGGG
jgi:hypothetical protein